MQCAVKLGSHGQPNGRSGTQQKPSGSKTIEIFPCELRGQCQ